MLECILCQGQTVRSVLVTTNYLFLLIVLLSNFLGQNCKDAWKDIPQDWLEGLNIKTQVSFKLGIYAYLWR